MTKLSIFIGLLISASIAFAAPIVEIATEEQLRSANCALLEMPEKSKVILLNATRKYINHNNGIELSQAFQMDDVPYYLSKCFKVHATMTLQLRKSNRDFLHFYDQSERFMRFLLIEEIARSGGADAKTIKELKQYGYNQVITLNDEYY
jgi:hypothetical protein